MKTEMKDKQKIGMTYQEDAYYFLPNDVKSAVELLRLQLCDSMLEDKNGNKLTCIQAFKKQSYKKRRCLNCEIIDQIFPDSWWKKRKFEYRINN